MVLGRRTRKPSPLDDALLELVTDGGPTRLRFRRARAFTAFGG